MRKIIFYLSCICLLAANEMVAQETFATRAKAIALRIDQINKEEKEALKEEIEGVNRLLQSGQISAQEAEQQKAALSEARAKNIEDRVAEEQEKLDELVKDQVDGRFAPDSSRTITLGIGGKSKKRKAGEPRTTSQLVFATGFNHLETNKSIAHSDYSVWKSGFVEAGLTMKTRIMKNNNLLHAKYGLSVMSNKLSPTDNRYFAVDGLKTELVEAPFSLKTSRMSNTYLTLPVHLEFDFGKPREIDGKRIFRSHQSFRLGVGGFIGGRISSRQVLKYTDADDHHVKQITNGNYNTNDFIYGVSAYIGYSDLSLYAKYDLNPMFRNNDVEQRNVSLGIRFDFH